MLLAALWFIALDTVAKDLLSPLHTAFWLTDLTAWPTSALVQLAATSAQVARDATGTGRRTGLYDFEGRTFAGWHRHITLASTAHAAALLLLSRDRGVPRRPTSPAGHLLRPKEAP